MICDPDLAQTQDLIKKLKRSGIQYRRLLPSANLEVVTELTASGAGIGIIPARVANFRARKELQKIPRAPVFHDEICSLYRTENRGVRAIQFIAEQIALSVR